MAPAFLRLLVLSLLCGVVVAAQVGDGARFLYIDGGCATTLAFCGLRDDCNTTTCTLQIYDRQTGKSEIVTRQSDKPEKKKYIVTLPSSSATVSCTGTSRLDAITSCGFTVWTEAEWADAKRAIDRLKKDDLRDLRPK